MRVVKLLPGTLSLWGSRPSIRRSHHSHPWWDNHSSSMSTANEIDYEYALNKKIEELNLFTLNKTTRVIVSLGSTISWLPGAPTRGDTPAGSLYLRLANVRTPRTRNWERPFSISDWRSAPWLSRFYTQETASPCFKLLMRDSVSRPRTWSVISGVYNEIMSDSTQISLWKNDCFYT
jgi:hypothetical protein